MDFIMVPAITGIVTYGIYSLFELFARRKERMALIEKLGSGSLQRDIKMGRIEYSNKFNALKWACLLIGLGLGLLVGFILIQNYGITRDKEIVYGASVLLCGGLGMLGSFLIEYRLSKKKTE